jgi:hypothetical protein
MPARDNETKLNEADYKLISIYLRFLWSLHCMLRQRNAVEVLFEAFVLPSSRRIIISYEAPKGSTLLAENAFGFVF